MGWSVYLRCSACFHEMGLFLDRCKSRRSGGTDPVSKGPWTEAEDKILTECVEKYGDRCWRQIPKHGGKPVSQESCRMLCSAFVWTIENVVDDALRGFVVMGQGC